MSLQNPSKFDKILLAIWSLGGKFYSESKLDWVPLPKLVEKCKINDHTIRKYVKVLRENGKLKSGKKKLTYEESHGREHPLSYDGGKQEVSVFKVSDRKIEYLDELENKNPDLEVFY